MKAEATKLREKLDTGLKAKSELFKLLSKITDDPPSTPIFYTFATDKWSTDYRANFLLHFIEMKGLSQEADNFLSIFSKSSDEEV